MARSIETGSFYSDHLTAQPFVVRRDSSVQNEKSVTQPEIILPQQRESVYSSPLFELESPIGDEKRITLVENLLHSPEEGIKLWQSSENLKYITQNEATHMALDRVYSGPLRSEEKSREQFEIADLFLSNLHTSMAARNRFRIVQDVYRQEISDHFSLNGHSGEMNTLSIAAGSSRALMEKMAGTEDNDRLRMNLRLVDASDIAVADGVKLAEELGIQDTVTVRQTNFLRFNHYLEEGYSPRFTEIVGLFDYVPNKFVVKTLEKVREQMPDGGSVLYSSVTPNDEQDFLHSIIGWRPMVYRTAEEMTDLALQAGFITENTLLIEEPLKMCNLVLARK